MSDSKLIWVATVDDDDESFFVAPLGTPLPTNALSVLDDDFEGCGWMGEDGFKNHIDRKTTQKRAFSGQVIKTVQDSYDETFKVTFYERKPVNLQVLFGSDNIIADYSSGHRKLTIRHDDKPLPRQSFVVRVTEPESGKIGMWVIPEGQVTEIAETTITHNELLMYEATVYCYKPAKGSNPGNPAAVNEYTDEPDVLEPGT